MIKCKYSELDEMFQKNKKKNYVTLTIIYVLVIALVLYVASWYQTYNDYKSTIPVLRNTVSEITTTELDHYILENSDVVVYMCIANDKECRNLDTSLKKELLKNGLQTNITYIDLQEVTSKKDYIDSIFHTYNNTSTNISGVPLLLAFKDGKIVSYLESTDNMKLTAKDTIKFIRKYSSGV